MITAERHLLPDAPRRPDSPGEEAASACMHIAEILEPEASRDDTRHADSAAATVRRRRRARRTGTTRRSGSCASKRDRRPHSCRSGRRCASRRRRSRRTRCRGWTTTWSNSRRTRTRTGARCTGRATPPSTTGSCSASCEAHGVQRLVKSKSMLTEECHLNPYLEEHGIEVVDTDLGERIVQLRRRAAEPHRDAGDPHQEGRSRANSSTTTSARRAGLADPKYLAEAARGSTCARSSSQADAGAHRRELRHRRDGRLRRLHQRRQRRPRASRCPVHIASMGIEKLIPRAARPGRVPAAAGPLAPPGSRSRPTRRTSTARAPGGDCTSCWSTTAAARMLGSEEFRRSLNCIRCGACMNTCPVYRRSGGHSYGVDGARAHRLGPRAGPRPRASYAALPFASQLCGSCTDVCPVKIDLHHQLLTWRGELARQAGPLAQAGRLERGGFVLAAHLGLSLLRRSCGSSPRRARSLDAPARPAAHAARELPGAVEETCPPAMRSWLPARAVPGVPLPEVGRLAAVRYPDVATRFGQRAGRVGGRCGGEGTAGAALLAASRSTPQARRWPPSSRRGKGQRRSGTIADPHARGLDFPSRRRSSAWPRTAPAGSHHGGANRAAAFLTQHLAVVVRGDRDGHNLHEATPASGFPSPGFAIGSPGPSKTADIEQALVIGAHGARSCTVLVVG